MQKPISILLLILFSYLSFGYSIHLFAKLYAIRTAVKQELKKGVPKQELHSFEINLQKVGENVDGYVWVHPKEFSINGQFYDVVYADTTEQTVVLQCVSDTQESELFQNLNGLVLKQHQDNKQEKSAHSFVIQLLSIAIQNKNELTYYLQEIGVCLTPYTNYRTIVANSACTPPPELI